MIVASDGLNPSGPHVWLGPTHLSCRMPADSLPGHDLIEAGIRDLEQGIVSVSALLVSIGAPRLRQLGFRVPPALSSPEHRLYELLAETGPDSAHSRYNALVRRLVSFERAAECAR